MSDSTERFLDSLRAVDYMDGTTLNPLVVGHNDTMNSDKRIFSSDSNATMRRYAPVTDLPKLSLLTRPFS